MGDLHVLIATPLDESLAARIAEVDSRIVVHHHPELLPVPRYAADHAGVARDLSAQELALWQESLAVAEVSLGVDWWAPTEVPVSCPQLRWIQGVSSGMAGYLRKVGLLDAGFTVTTAAGLHGTPLAEFALAGVLHFVKGVPKLLAQQSEHRWHPTSASSLAGRRALVVGLGALGTGVAGLFSAMGVDVWGVATTDRDRGLPGVSRYLSFTDIDGALSEVDIVVLCCPLTEQTENLLDADRLALLPAHAIVVNIARGAVLDERALAAALRSGRLGAACLDVVREEPLPPNSELWDLPNVLISPHSAANLDDENVRLVELFADNLRRYLEGAPLRNVFDPKRGY